MPGPVWLGATAPANAPPTGSAAASAAPTTGTLTPPQSAQPNPAQPPPAPVSAGTAASGSAAGGSLGAPAGAPAIGAAPISPPVPTAVPGLTQTPPFSSMPIPGTPNASQTLPATPPTSFSLVTAGAKPLRLTADDAVMLAAGQNLGVLAALREALAARSGVRSASALSPPIFTVGPALQMGGTTDGFLFQQPLELNGTRGARAGIARAQLRLTQAQALVQLQALVYVTRLNFYTLAQAQERLRLARDLRAIAERFDAIARRQVALGARPGIERRQTAIEVARARAQEAQTFGQEQAARAVLNAYLGRAALDPVEAALGAEGGESQLPVPEVVLDVVLAQRRALDVRGEIAAAEATRDIPAAQARLSRAQGRPDIAPSFRISQITPTYMDAGLGVVVTIPLDYGTRREQIRQQEQTAQADAARVTGTQAQVRSEVVQAAARLSAAQEALRGYDGGLLAEAKAVLDAAQIGFREGATTIISVLEAQRTYRGILSERLDALTQAALAQAELDRAAGTVPPALLTRLRQGLASEKELGAKELGAKDSGAK